MKGSALVSKLERARQLTARLTRPFSRFAPYLPSERAFRGAAWGLAIASVAVLLLDTTQYTVGTTTFLMVALGVPIFTLLAIVVGLAAAGAIRLVGFLPPVYRRVLWGSLFLLYDVVLIGEPSERYAILVPTVVLGSIIGGAAVSLRKEDGEPKGRTLLARGLLVGGVAASLTLIAYYFVGGALGPNPTVIHADAKGGVAPPALSMPDPSAPGPFTVKFLTYGSGNSIRRPEYLVAGDLKTPVFDGSPYVQGWNGTGGKLRTKYFGFDAAHMPLNARVFYPDGPGPFPVAMIVHGNHMMEDVSEPGYDYLGEHLASRGYVFVSVDENFLNGAPWSKLGGFGVGGISGENPARGVLLLEHLQVLRAWSTQDGHPLFGKVDLDNVALLGHSRGGEAIAIAAAFNRMTHPPDDATLSFHYGFGIRALVALSTTDGQYRPGGAQLPISDVDFLALQGSWDGDQEHFRGMIMYDRVRLAPGSSHFKASLYVHRANHGQWSRAWGRIDLNQFQRKWFLDTAPILPPADQEKIAKAYVTAFLDASLKGDKGYLPLFRDQRVGSAFLPQTPYIGRYADANTTLVASYQDDVDASTLELPGAKAEGADLVLWKEELIGRRDKWIELQNRGALLGWDAAKKPSPTYTISLPPGLSVAASDSLVFDVADPLEVIAGPKGPREPKDFSLELADRNGKTARISLSEGRLVQPLLETKIWKAKVAPDRSPEPVLGTWDLPLTLFTAKTADLDTSSLATIRFVFDKMPKGTLLLDDVGFRRSHP